MAGHRCLYDFRNRHQTPRQCWNRRKGPYLVSALSSVNQGASLAPEQSFGYDTGIDQSLFNGRATVSLTGFSNKFSNLIDFVSIGPGVSCPVVNPTGMLFQRFARRNQRSGSRIQHRYSARPREIQRGLHLPSRGRSCDRPGAGAAAEEPGALCAHHHADRQMADRTARPHGVQALQQRRRRPARSMPTPVSISIPSTRSTGTGKCSRAARTF